MSFVEDRFQIERITRSTLINARVKRQTAWNYVLARETEDGSRFIVAEPEGETYFFSAHTRRAIRLSEGGRGAAQMFAYLHSRYGLPEQGPMTREVYDCLRLYAHQQGSRVPMRRFAVWSKERACAYVSRYDGSMWRLDGQSVEVIPNGDEDVFFLDDDGGVHVDLEPGDLADHGELLPALTDLSFSTNSPGGITDEDQRRALIIWILSLVFPDLMPTKPILLIEGTQGSGKSSALQMLQLVLLGHKKPLILSRSREDDFGVMLLRSPIAYFDNVDSFIDWLPDAVCAYATTGMWTKRKLYTDGEEAQIRPHAFVAVASKNPASFRREDTADRCVVIRLERRAAFTAQADRESAATAARPRLLGEYLTIVNRMVDAIRRGAGTPAVDSTYRMADFATMAHLAADALGWEDGAAAQTLKALQAERDAFASEGDPLVDLLAAWLGHKVHRGPSNVGRQVTAIGLHTELESIAQMRGIEIYKVGVLAQKLRSPHLERHFVIERGQPINGQPTFRLWRHTDPRLSVVPMAATGTPYYGEDDD